MSRENRHKKRESDLKDQSTALFARTQIPFEKSREEVWNELSAQLRQGSSPGDDGRHIRFRPWILLAASIALLFAVATFMRFYPATKMCPPGEQATLELPDGSVAELNALTTITYHPLWWPFSKRIDLEGEAFFNVKKGKKFMVVTKMGTTEVLGTAFNVYARKDRFRVTCHSGLVRVISRGSKQTVSLSPDKRAELNPAGEFDITDVKVDPYSPEWKSDLLMFNSVPLRLVFNEIERQYGIMIETPEEMPYIFSGHFALDPSVEKVLSLLCRPFDLVYERTSGSEYRIYPSPVD